MSRLAGRRALVTGGASGIGLATAVRLAADGAAVVVADARPTGVAAVVGDPSYGIADAVLCDVSREPDVLDAVERTVARLGGLDILVTAAGIHRSGDTDSYPLDEWNLVIGVNLTGTFLAIKHSVGHLVSAGGGAIVTIGSVASIVAARRAASYDASKGAVLQLTRSVAVEYADRDIRANCICPGHVATGLAANSAELHGAPREATHEAAASRIDPPLSRRADPAEIAGVVAFLVSDDASFLTGAAIAVDGGYTAI